MLVFTKQCIENVNNFMSLPWKHWYEYSWDCNCKALRIYKYLSGIASYMYYFLNIWFLWIHHPVFKLEVHDIKTIKDLQAFCFSRAAPLATQLCLCDIACFSQWDVNRCHVRKRVSCACEMEHLWVCIGHQETLSVHLVWQYGTVEQTGTWFTEGSQFQGTPSSRKQKFIAESHQDQLMNGW